ncbi:MAG: DUF2807 domain-containing protein [Cyclobacteriaceae bacterium]
MLFKLKYCFLLTMFGLIISCDDDGLEEETLHESLSPFSTVELNSVFDVYLVEDTIYALNIRGHGNAIKNIEFKVENEILRISNRSRVKWIMPDKNKVKLFIHSKTLKEVRPNETCFITTVNPITADEFRIVMGHNPKLSRLDLELNCRTFYYWNNHQCGGKLTITGKAEDLMIYIYGLMSVDANELAADNVWIENNSKGDCNVRADKWIQYSIRGVGNIYLYGSPEVIIPQEVTSSGKLIPMD